MKGRLKMKGTGPEQNKTCNRCPKNIPNSDG